MKTKALKKILRKHGCYCTDDSAGGHEQWCSPITKKFFGVPRHPTTNLYTARAILKQAGIDQKI